MARKIDELARITNLRAVPKDGLFGSPFAAGNLDGFLVKAGYTRLGNQAVTAYRVRFKANTWAGDVEMLREAAAGSEALKEALGRKKVPGTLVKALVLEPDALVLNLTYSFVSPRPAKVAAILKALVGLARTFASPIGTACESCGSEAGARVFLADQVPVSVCAGCRSTQDAEAVRQEEDYRRMDSNPFLGLVYGAATAAVLALAWAGVAYAVDRIFAYAAILMGSAIAWMVNRGMGKINLQGRILTVVFTVASVMGGHYLFLLFAVARLKELPISFDLAMTVARVFPTVAFAESTGVLSFVFSLIGAGYVLYANRPPKFRKAFEPLGN